MPGEINAYRQCVLDALGRMADVESRLRAEAEERDDAVLERCHEHGEFCLREAQSAIRSIPRV